MAGPLAKAEQLKARTKRFAVQIVKLSASLPKTDQARVIGNQLLRSGTSTAANYRATCRARSKAEFVAKLGVVVEEADETVYWLELLQETGILAITDMNGLYDEAKELLAIFAASQQTVRSNNVSMRKSSNG